MYVLRVYFCAYCICALSGSRCLENKPENRKNIPVDMMKVYNHKKHIYIYATVSEDLFTITSVYTWPALVPRLGRKFDSMTVHNLINIDEMCTHSSSVGGNVNS